MEAIRSKYIFKHNGDLTIEDAKILYHNFNGDEREFNAKGVRSVNVIIDDSSFAQQLQDEGWNVKLRAPKADGEVAIYHIPVFIRYDSVPPRVYMITREGRRKTLLEEENVGRLDNMDLIAVDIEIHPYEWDKVGHRKKAYVTDMYCTVEDKSAFARKYDFDAPVEDEEEELPFN